MTMIAATCYGCWVGSSRSVAWRIHAYVLMGNHYHLLLETPEPTLSQGMHQLNGAYTRRFNVATSESATFSRGDSRQSSWRRSAHLLELIRYVVLNPVRAGLVPGPGQWEWSNYAAPRA